LAKSFPHRDSGLLRDNGKLRNSQTIDLTNV
jgi:hypothetical protein